ncbi:hypothetical protein HPB47_001014 [Ixodes persulcatus]|uniref:Uncharacterized protein n=1 Tax=Ixodes persulcatus TaxID=34615 RepID=A0AC60PQ63_IXOPE|nr:hypothetical protein HPB47_001014 [Ixodes persulcatus]
MLGVAPSVLLAKLADSDNTSSSDDDDEGRVYEAKFAELFDAPCTVPKVKAYVSIVRTYSDKAPVKAAGELWPPSSSPRRAAAACARRMDGYPVEWPHWQKLHAILGKRPVPHSWNNYYDDERTSESRIVRSENGSMHYDEPEIEFPEFRAGDLQFQNLQPISRLPIAPKREPIEDITLEPEVNICYDNDKGAKRKCREEGDEECEPDSRKRRKDEELDLLRRILKVEEDTLELEKKRALEEADILKATMGFLEAATGFMQQQQHLQQRSDRPQQSQQTSTPRPQASSNAYCNGGLPVVGAPLYTTQPSFYSSSPVDSPGKSDPVNRADQAQVARRSRVGREQAHVTPGKVFSGQSVAWKGLPLGTGIQILRVSAGRALCSPARRCSSSETADFVVPSEIPPKLVRAVHGV